MLPILFQNPDFIIYSYPLFMGIGWGVGYQLFFSRNKESLWFSQLLFWGVFITSWLGAKLLFLLTAPKIDQLSLIENVNFWTGGGFVFFGGFLAAVLFLLVLHKLRPLSSETVWSFVPALTIGHAIGRIGCFLAGCCFGKETNWFWGIHLHGADRHPTQVLESLGLFVIALIIWKRKADLKSLSIYLISYGALRLIVESLRGDEIRGVWGLLTPSQWISLFLVLTGLSLLRKSGTWALANRNSQV
jgi:phosphatidylglycerol---prolipoprotein diacylglyceryl transferase